MKEESGLDLPESQLDLVGVLLFEFVDDPQIWEVHIFRTTQFSGEMTETDGNNSSTFFSSQTHTIPKGIVELKTETLLHCALLFSSIFINVNLALM